VGDQQERSARLRVDSQTALIRFLSTDIDLAFTLLETAKTTRDSARTAALIAKARLALESIRHLAERIDDPREWHEIRERANLLEYAVNST
jgi:hypothetical protein